MRDVAPEYDPHYSTSLVLTEVRTLLKRARGAMERLADQDRYATDSPGFRRHDGGDLAQIKAALVDIVATLSPWERHLTTKENH